MFKHYITVAFRNFFRNKIYSLINILGLAVGMGVCILIYQYVQFESSYDKFHSNAAGIYRVTTKMIRNGEFSGITIGSGHALGSRGKENIPEIKDFVRIHPQDGNEIVTNPENDKHFKENNLLFVDSNFLQMFSFPLLRGNIESALDKKYNVVISAQTAIKYFGDNDPVGKTLIIKGGRAAGNFLVTGVLKTLPTNSHLQFDMLLSTEILLEDEQYKGSLGWGWTNFTTYINVGKTVNLNILSEKYGQVITTYASDILERFNLEYEIDFQPVVDIHLKSSHLKGDLSKNNGDIQDVQFFSIIAIFILIIAYVNYINLSTGQAIKRAKEVGVRKSIGAQRRQLIFQFMTESALINLIASILSVGIAYSMMYLLNDILGQELKFDVLQNPKFWLFFLVVTAFGSILSGLYGAFVMSSYKPLSALKSLDITPKRGFSLRNGLIVFQFFIATTLISGTYLVYEQIAFMKSRDLGINLEQVLVLNGPSVALTEENQQSKLEIFKSKLNGHHSISRVSGSGSVPSKDFNWGTSIHKLGGVSNVQNEPGYIVFADADFNKVYDFKFLAGSSFEKKMLNQGNKTIINEEAVRAFGLDSPEEALNEELVIQGDPNDTLQVIGVLKNFHWNSLNNAQVPRLFMLDNEYSPYISLKVSPKNIGESLKYIESTYHSVFPDDPFDYFFLDDEFDRQYQSDTQFGSLFSAFSILAIFISCLGLFALVSFSTTLRIKEIGVRKILGASIGNLMLLLSRQYIVLLFIANVIAIPAIVYWSSSWLDNYAFKIGIGIELFLIPGLLLIVISLVTVSYRTYVAASANPLESLRSE